jgi:hypothetical protein
MVTGCTSSGSGKNSCGSGGLTARVNGKSTDLLSCAGVVFGRITLSVHVHSTVSILGTYGPGKHHPVLTSPQHDLARIADAKIVAEVPGSVIITQSGWPCASQRHSCPLLTLVIS